MYGSKDKFFDQYNTGEADKSKYGFNWGNFTGLFRWNSQLKENAFLNTSLYYSQYNYKQEEENNYNGTKQSREINSSIKEWNISSALDYYPFHRHEIKTGLQLSFKTFHPEIAQLVNGSRATLKTDDDSKQALNANFFIEDNFKISPEAQLELGLRNSCYYQGNKSNLYLQPRAKFSYALLPNLQLQASYDNIAQHIHLLTNTTLGQPTDLWLPATSKAPTELAQQYNIAIQKSFSAYEASVSTYIKDIRNVIEYQEGANIMYGIDQGWEDKIYWGKGHSKGIEGLVSKKRSV
jgi:hypothetical protein